MSSLFNLGLSFIFILLYLLPNSGVFFFFSPLHSLCPDLSLRKRFKTYAFFKKKKKEYVNKNKYKNIYIQIFDEHRKR